jgi:hypothetical protein
MTTYTLSGFCRQKHDDTVCMIVDADDSEQADEIVERITGPAFCFPLV